MKLNASDERFGSLEYVRRNVDLGAAERYRRRPTESQIIRSEDGPSSTGRHKTITPDEDGGSVPPGTSGDAFLIANP